MTKFAVMSDLHIGIEARAKDLCPEPPTSSSTYSSIYKLKTEDDYRQKFVEFIEREHITADYLVLPGDLTNDAEPDEVQIASEFVLQAADALSVPYNKIVFAPGNHDVDWSVLNKPDRTGVRWEQRYLPIGHNNFHFRSLVEQGEGDILAPPHFISWVFEDIIAVSYNSASHDSPIQKDAAHHGLADPDHIDKLRVYLKSLNHLGEHLRLFLVHHHPVEFPNPISKTPDFSLMTNADSLLSLLHEYNFDLLIHGHKHHPHFGTHSTQTYPHLPILSSGSFSVKIDSEWAGAIANQFHLVNVDGRTGTKNPVRGKIISWANNHSRGWFPSEEFSCGIHHIVPFGNYVTPDELDPLLKPFIEGKFKKTDCVLWKHVLKKFPELEHLPVKSAEAAFERLAKTLNCEIYYNTSIHGLMLSKKD